jgi:hypothetical protein
MAPSLRVANGAWCQEVTDAFGPDWGATVAGEILPPAQGQVDQQEVNH